MSHNLLSDHKLEIFIGSVIVMIISWIIFASYPDEIQLVKQSITEIDDFCSTQECVDLVNQVSMYFGIAFTIASTFFGLANFTSKIDLHGI